MTPNLWAASVIAAVGMLAIPVPADTAVAPSLTPVCAADMLSAPAVTLASWAKPDDFPLILTAADALRAAGADCVYFGDCGNEWDYCVPHCNTYYFRCRRNGNSAEYCG